MAERSLEQDDDKERLSTIVLGGKSDAYVAIRRDWRLSDRTASPPKMTITTAPPSVLFFSDLFRLPSGSDAARHTLFIGSDRPLHCKQANSDEFCDAAVAG